MGLGNKRVPTCSRLLKRRYSVPEIIMRKHELAQQKPYGNFNSESVPSSKIPPSTGISNSNSTSSISRNVLPDSPGSDTNLSRTGLDTSLRKTSLLRQMWGKENRFRQGKTSSLRLLFQKGYSAEGTDSHCEECRRLNISRDDDDLEVNSQGYLLNSRLKQMKKPTSSETASSTSDVSQLASQISTQESLGCKQESYTSAEQPELCTTGSLECSSSDVQKIEQESFYNSEIKDPSTVSDQPETSSTLDDVENGDSTLDVFISQMLIENLHDLAEEARERCKRKQYIECFKVKGNCTTLSDNGKTCADNEDSTEPDSTTTPCTLQVTTDPTEDANENISDEASGYLRELDNIPCDDIIQIRAGSLYPSFAEDVDLLVIPRVLNILPRTESVEVQPSSASAVEEEAYCHNSDESLSLVDSLDDPNIDADNETSPASPTQENNENCENHQPCLSKGKPKAFFVPIVDLGNENVENIPDVSETMPEKLKERIEQRQMELDAKKECYKKVHHTQPTFEEFHNIKPESDVTSQKKLKPKNFPLEGKSQSRSSKDSKEILRNDIGLLESYTIDSRGNLKFLPPQKAKLRAGNTHKSKIVKKQNIVTYRPPKSMKTSSGSSSYTKKHKVSPKDIQKMTIFQTQSDIITPDHENGPKRIYQKTEIQDGEKRIEILEIVECIESSDENSPVRQTRPKYIAKSASLRRSRIPVPIYKIGRSAGCQKPVRHRDCCHIFGHAVHRDIPQSISPKVDKAIADLLMGALNRSDQTVIEVLRSPREILSSRASRGQIISKRNTPKRSSSSGKYRQVFEVIPEEKSSLSMDSSNEESSKDVRNSEDQSGISTNATGSITSNTNTTKPIISSTTFTTTPSPNSAKTPSRGREAVESIEPKAWVGFLNTQESFIEEDDGTTQSYPSSTTENSYYTITSISTAAATQGTQTPRNASVPRTISTESDCILEVIRKSNSGLENTECRGEFPSKQGTKSPSTLKNRNIIQVRECKNMNVHENLNISQEDKNSVDGKLMHHKPCNQADNVGVWRVQSPDTCMQAKSKTCSEYQNCPGDCETAEIDSRSFIICSDDSAINNSDQTSTTQNDLQECTKAAKEASNACLTCCFCNPDLHHAKTINLEYCLYCNRKKTPQKKEEETNTESDFFAKEQDIYQTTLIKDHRHTMSRDSDSVSTKCTRTNEKIKRYIPDSSRASSESCSNPKKNLNRPKNINNLPKFEKKPVSKVTKDTVKGKSSSKKSEEFENKLGSFPSPYKQFSACGYDRSSSPTSSSDTTCPTTPERRLLFPKVKCRNSRGKIKKSNEAVVKDLKKGTSTEKAPLLETNNTNAGWTVTLAGTCTQGPPPDVEMRLSFPKDAVATAMNKIEGIGDKNLLENLAQKDLTYDRNGNARRHSVLPPTGNTDSRRTLPNTQTGTSFQRDLIFPEVTLGTPLQNQVVPRHVTTKKAIRHLECNVAVTSATRTVSNITRGRRTMSYQTLNTGEPQKYSSRERQLRDSSLDLGFLSSRRMSFGSQSPLETMALSIMGNAIAPEQKPRVPTMSEKDLTRRHNRCFTRNRAFFT